MVSLQRIDVHSTDSDTQHKQGIEKGRVGSKNVSYKKPENTSDWSKFVTPAQKYISLFSMSNIVVMFDIRLRAT